MLFCMKKHGRRLASMICTAACTMAMVSAFNVSAYVPYRSFHYISYQSEERQVECPAPFLIDKVVKPDYPSGDICIGADRKLYLADTGNSRILVLNADGIVFEEISSFTADGEKQNFQKPGGCFLRIKTEICMLGCTENNRVVVLTESRQWVKNITVEENDVFGEGYVFILVSWR